MKERGEFLKECGDFLKGERGVRGDLAAEVISSCVVTSVRQLPIRFDIGDEADLPCGCTSRRRDQTTRFHQLPSPSAWFHFA